MVLMLMLMLVFQRAVKSWWVCVRRRKTGVRLRIGKLARRKAVRQWVPLLQRRTQVR